MSKVTVSSSSAEVRPGSPRPRLHLVYYALALFDLVTVSLGLYLIDRITSIYTDSVAVNQVWAQRLGDYSELSKQAIGVNAPGNDVFISLDVDAESARLVQELAVFNELAAAVREELVGNVGQIQAVKLLTAFDAMDTAMQDMVAEANLIFSYFRDNQRQRAGQRMAVMDRKYAEVNWTLTDLGDEVRQIQKSYLDEQLAVARSLRRFEFIIAGLIVIMVGGVTFYGHKLAQRMKQTAREMDAFLNALAESEARLQSIMDNTAAVVFLKDTEGRYLLVNRRFEELFHVTRTQAVGHTDFDLFPKEIAEGFRVNDREVLRTGSVTQFEEVAPHDDGPHTYIAIKFPLYDADAGLYAICGISTDITERKQAEVELARHREHLEDLVAERTADLEATHEQLRLADRLASIGTLAAGLGHDMNNVLLPLRCRLNVLKTVDLPEKLKDHFEAVEKLATYLQQLADGLHLLSLDPEDAAASSEGTDISTWWEQVGPLLARGLPKHAGFTIALPDDLPEVAVAPHRLTQAVLNLIVNAGEAVGEDGQVRLWANQFEDRRFVRLGVTDNGHGMTSEVKRCVLDPFFTTKKRGLGTGLGMSLVRGAVQSAGGSIEIESAPGEGTTVLLILPASSDPVADALYDEVDSAPLAVLSVRDRRTATFVAMLLASAGFQVKHAEASDVCACALWIAEPSPAALEAVRKLDTEQRPRIVLFGRTSNDWKDLAPTIIEDPADVDSIRQAISGVWEALA